METLCFEGVKLTCRMEAAREERNRINQPPSPSTNTHTHSGAMDWLSHRQEHPVLPTTAAHAEFYAFLHIPGRAPRPPRQGRCPELIGRASRATSAGSAPARSLPSTAHPAVEA